MTIFGSPRGSFKAIELDTSKGRGVVLDINGQDPVGASSLVTSFSVTQAENYAISQCLNGGVFMYTFGHDPQRSQFGVGVTSFLQPCTGSMGEDVNKAVSIYRSGRVSESKKTASMTVGNGIFRGYLIGQGLEVVDAQLGIVNTTYTFIALDAH